MYKRKRATCRNDMIRRVDTKRTYSNCSICDEWRTDRKSFNDWYDVNYHPGWDLDKDLLGDGTLYSPDTCMFIPHEVNLLFRKSTNKTGYAGVSKKGNKYLSKISIEGSTIYLGMFDTAEEAHEAFISRKKERLIELSKRYDSNEKLSKLLWDAGQ